jgi:hypothetical protein
VGPRVRPFVIVVCTLCIRMRSYLRARRSVVFANEIVGPLAMFEADGVGRDPVPVSTQASRDIGRHGLGA